ncbi:MAG TPA: dephospho-CoA kinase [Syntrophales bacterium]|nr:dephospho-CoA kinase [Syntrophales bacterium]HQM29015.1 dephospho-CoA kinase [Syntrophales bacterium]
MLNVGLTGGIASGKSTVVRMLVEKGAFVVDHDRLAHMVYEPGGPSYGAIIARFGREVLAPGGKIDRKKLGEIVFKNSGKLQDLNAIVHPVVLAEWKKRLAEIEKQNPAAIVLSDVPLLIEVGWQDRVDLVLLVYASPRLQVERIMKRDGYTEKEARARVDAQMPMEEKRRYAHLIVENNGILEDLQKQVDAVWVELVRREREKRLKSSGR